MASSSKDQIEDQDQAFWFLAEQLADCIEELETLDKPEKVDSCCISCCMCCIKYDFLVLNMILQLIYE